MSSTTSPTHPSESFAVRSTLHKLSFYGGEFSVFGVSEGRNVIIVAQSSTSQERNVSAGLPTEKARAFAEAILASVAECEAEAQRLAAIEAAAACVASSVPEGLFGCECAECVRLVADINALG